MTSGDRAPSTCGPHRAPPLRSYLDEAGLRFRGAAADIIRDAIDDLVDVVDAIRGREDEEVWKSHDIYQDAEVEPGLQLVDFLFPEEPGDPVLVDARRRLIAALDRVGSWEDDGRELEVSDYEVQVGGEEVFSPSLAQAVAADDASGPVAVLSLSTAREGGSTFVAAVGEDSALLHAVTSLEDRPGFVRAWLARRRPTPARFAEFTDRAFPDLAWTDEARAGLRANARWFFEDRFETTMKHLSVLNDHAAHIFHASPENRVRERHLNAHGVNASHESPNTRGNRRAAAQRRLHWAGREVSFWWHTKIRYDSGRIHFHHEDDDRGPGRIVIGLCVQHLDV